MHSPIELSFQPNIVASVDKDAFGLYCPCNYDSLLCDGHGGYFAQCLGLVGIPTSRECSKLSRVAFPLSDK